MAFYFSPDWNHATWFSVRRMSRTIFARRSFPFSIKKISIYHWMDRWHLKDSPPQTLIHRYPQANPSLGKKQKKSPFFLNSSLVRHSGTFDMFFSTAGWTLPARPVYPSHLVFDSVGRYLWPWSTRGASPIPLYTNHGKSIGWRWLFLWP